ncbi:MAG: hypothetical protein ABSB89_11005 [Candidatus Bathyarchaeia archaeon]
MYFSPTISSYFQSSSSNSSNNPSASFTTLMIRAPYSGHEENFTTVDFGDTEYNFLYGSGWLAVYAPLQAEYPISYPEVGDTYNAFGLEIKIENVSSDYLSDYVIFGVKPTVTNYMYSTYRYTEVNLTLEQSQPIQYGTVPLTNYSVTVSISSGIINETNQYTFTYTNAPSGTYGATLVVSNSSQSKQYEAYVGSFVAGAETDFNIEIGVYKADANNMIIYVKPLY